jgi:hypothetical protein
MHGILVLTVHVSGCGHTAQHVEYSGNSPGERLDCCQRQDLVSVRYYMKMQCSNSQAVLLKASAQAVYQVLQLRSLLVHSEQSPVCTKSTHEPHHSSGFSRMPCSWPCTALSEQTGSRMRPTAMETSSIVCSSSCLQACTRTSHP